MDQSQKSGLVRHVAATYAEFYRPKGITILPELARSQLDAYVSALRSAGVDVQYVAADNAYPDCVFIEDVAVVFGSCALISHMTPHREGEQRAVEPILQRTHQIVRLPAGAQLEGGDVLHIGSTTYVGLTGRTNSAGVAALRECLRPLDQEVVAVPSKKSLHLKSVVTYLGNGTIVVAPDFIDTNSFAIENVIFTDRNEIRAANCLRINQHLLIARGNPATEKLLRDFAEQNDVTVVVLDLSEFEKGDGSLTCLSLIW